MYITYIYRVLYVELMKSNRKPQKLSRWNTI